jgi:hypothetical protein
MRAADCLKVAPNRSTGLRMPLTQRAASPDAVPRPLLLMRLARRWRSVLFAPPPASPVGAAALAIRNLYVTCVRWH